MSVSEMYATEGQMIAAYAQSLDDYERGSNENAIAERRAKMVNEVL